ncbi:MAG: Sialic acid TRAP transporter permease protein SiaT [Syntrophaceae bacterium PtaU1.Bin231]|nr:MAG: Sialic acid TRAP transporter permease protein SiaT [Syntrophaceae bacterium PtaU1.Bin231]
MELAIGITFICIMIVLMVLGVPIAFAMGASAMAGLFFVAGPDQAIMQASLVAWKECTGFTMVCIPLFVLMGQLVFYTGVAGDLYRAAYAWFGRMPGGLGIASVWGCAAFAAVTGSSVAAAATMGTIALPEMKRYKYEDGLATATVAIAGTLGILIPPSITFVFYAILTETSIGALFMAGVVPGVMTAAFYAAVIYVRCKLNPALGPRGERASWETRFRSLATVWPALVLFFGVLGGIYAGVFSPTEAAGAGAAGSLFIGLMMNRLKLKGYLESLMDTGRVAAMIFAIIIGGILFARFLTLTGVTEWLVSGIVGLKMNRYVIVSLLVVVYIFLGMILDVFGMIILTMPIVYPVMTAMGFDPIWFGVFIVIMSEVALVTPPVGANVFVVAGIARNVPLMTIFKGVAPLLAGNFAVLALMVAFPQIALWLPTTMLGPK